MATSGTILYVDDDDANLTVFRAALESEFDIVTASGADAALEVLGATDVAVLLADQRMPGTSGAELAEIVRQEHPDTQRYLVTAFSDLDAAIDAINKGHVRRYIRKPWDTAELRTALREGVELYRANRRVRELERRIRSIERIYSLGIVAASVAHELRNPALVMQTNIEVARESMDRMRRLLGTSSGVASAEMHRQLERAGDAVIGAAEASEIMSDILRGVDRSSRRSKETGWCDLVDVLRTTTKMIMGDLRLQAKLELDLRPVPRVKGSPTQLGQVVLNLMLNALQALPTDRPYGENVIRLRLVQDQTTVRFEVEDTGGGVPEHIRDKIFDPFFTTKESSGTGLGLAISKQIVEELGGRMEFATEIGRGTCFTITLPAESSSP